MSSEEAAASQPAAEEESTAHFEPVLKLTDADKVSVSTGEEAEKEVFKLRAKLFRFDREMNEWKERGTGDMKLLEHQESKKIRLLMRRDKTHKLCANHLITPDMELLPNIASERSWVWTCLADISDGERSAETLAVRFANVDNANAFKTKFNEAKESNAKLGTDAHDVPAAAPPAAAEAAESSTAESKQKDNDDAPAYKPAEAASSSSAPAEADSKPQSELTPAELKAQEAAKEAEQAKQHEGEAPPPAYE